MSPSSKTGLEQYGPPVALKADGTINCRACGLNIKFLPDEFPADQLPDGAPRTVNHTGCSQAKTGESPAPLDAHPPHFAETVNVVDQKEIAKFYNERAKRATK